MAAKIKSRLEVLVALIGLLMYWMIVQFSAAPLAPWVHVVVLGLAGVYLFLILSKPMRLPEKETTPFHWDSVVQAGRTMLLMVTVAAAINILLGLLSRSENGSSLFWFLRYLVLMVALGSVLRANSGAASVVRKLLSNRLPTHSECVC